MRSGIKELISRIGEKIGEEKLQTGEMIGADYRHDEYVGLEGEPEAVVEAGSTEEVAAVLRLCHEAGVPVTVRGAGTGQAGGSVPVNGGVVLSLRGMNRILGYDEGERTLRVQPGVLLQEVKAAAESHGLSYPPDPGEQTATIGGNAATNASGPNALKYGRTRDYVEDGVLVLADGAIVPLAGREAALGSEGTLAVITELTLKLVEKPGADAILLLPFMDNEAAINGAKAILTAGHEPAVLELMDTDQIEFSGRVTGNPVFPVELEGERAACTLMVTIEGADDDEVMERMEALAGLAEEGEIECLDILVGDTPTMKREFWAAHAAFHTSMEAGAKSAFEANVEVPAEAMAGMIAFAKEAAEAKDLKAYIHCHVGSGGMHIHVASDKNREESAPEARAFLDAVYARTAELGGDVAGEYGIGWAKKGYLSAGARGELAGLKAEYDPKGILNPGKVID